MYHRIAIIGSAGALGSALLHELVASHPDAEIHAFARQPSGVSSGQVHCHAIDYNDEASFARAAVVASANGPLYLIIVATGLLHQGDIMPEKALRDISADKLHALFAANAVVPALATKHFLPHIPKDKRAVFAAFSARVGSISDNRLGGWYAYRASKAALNMLIKTAAIEVRRRHKAAVVVGLHPGTVDSALSKPFQANVPPQNLFSPDYSARALLDVLAGLSADDSGKCFAFDGEEILP
ncbi:MAG TPA: short-chain dehydrogenase [Gammaproteobacteria bacterium]|nr:short-chain dehydrogenase [Gammaproteobacteria bacterium]